RSRQSGNQLQLGEVPTPTVERTADQVEAGAIEMAHHDVRRAVVQSGDGRTGSAVARRTDLGRLEIAVGVEGQVERARLGRGPAVVLDAELTRERTADGRIAGSIRSQRSE